MNAAVGPDPTVRVPVALLIVVLILCVVVVLVMVLRHSRALFERRAPLPRMFGDIALAVISALVAVLVLGALTLGMGEGSTPGPTITAPVLHR